MRDFPQASDIEIHPFVWMIPLMLVIYGGIAAFHWRKDRKPTGFDAIAWVIAGTLVSLVVMGSGRGGRLSPDVESFLTVISAVTIIACCVSWFRLLQEGKPEHIAWSIVLCVLIGSIALPAIQPARETGHGSPESRCKSNLHQIGLALYNYNEEYEEWPLQQAGDPPHSWRVDLLPYVDRPTLHDEYDFSAAWNAAVNRPVTNSTVPLYLCPSMDWPDRDKPVHTSYALLVGDHAAWTSLNVIDPDDIPDGAGNTAIVAEACGLNIIWTEPRDIDLATTQIGINLPGDAPGHSPGILSTYHSKGANVLMADGSVRRLAIETDRKVLEAITTADGGEDVGEF